MVRTYKRAGYYIIGKEVASGYFTPLLTIYFQLCIVNDWKGKTWVVHHSNRQELRLRFEQFYKADFAEGMIDWLVEHGLPVEFAAPVIDALHPVLITAGVEVQE